MGSVKPKPGWTAKRARELARDGKLLSPAALFAALSEAFRGESEPVKLARQDDGPAHAVFVSPSVREDSTIPEALRAYKSGALAPLESAAPSGQNGLGFWRDGAEESRLVHVPTPDDVPVVGAKLGKQFKQKAVIGFMGGSGADSWHTVRVPDRDPEKIHADLLRHGVEYKTVVPDATGSVVHILDTGSGLSDAVNGYAKEAGGRVTSKPGTVWFAGADTREDAAREYDRILGGATKAADPVKLARVDHVAAAGSINRAGRSGNTFVKEANDSGSPWAEEAAHKALTLLDVPHIPMHARELPSGRVLNFSPWVDGVKSISDVSREPNGFATLKAAVNHEQVAKTVFGEWVIGAGDRIGRNYAVHPQHGLIGNDYGHAFHPLTDEWILHKKKADSPVESYKSLAKSPSKYAEYHPNTTALASLLPHVGVSRDQFHGLKVPSDTVARLDAHYDDLLAAARHAVKDLPEDEAGHAVRAMQARLDAVRDHVRRTGSLTIRDLIALTDRVRNEATARGS